ncbi:MAG: hypothetical protein QOD69_3221 [Solirubrobacteraceae bacterium]|nr:hypothetical protein [Solirubrobacteraceae bacterium]
MTSKARIFINYRRSDASGWARQLHGDLSTRFGGDRVFRDIAIEPGVDYVEHIEKVMDACEVCIAVIGPRWADATSADGRRRLDDPDDLVCLEIQRALSRPDVHVIPALVDGATMPAEMDLPLGLRPLARRNAVQLSDARWDYDVEVLVRYLLHVLGESTVGNKRPVAAPPDDAPRPAGAPAVRQSPLLPSLATLGAAAGAAVVAVGVSDPLQGDSSMADWDRLASYAIERGVIWAIVGAAVAAAVAVAFNRSRVPLGPALVGAGAGLLGGAAGGAAHIALSRFGGYENGWLLAFVAVALPGVWLARVLARRAGAHTSECVLAALAGAAVAGLFSDGQRLENITLQIVIVVGATVAVLATTSYRATAGRPSPLQPVR